MEIEKRAPQPHHQLFSGTRVAKGTFYLTLQNIVLYAGIFIFYVIAARILSTEEIGRLALLNFVLSIMATVSQLAIPTAAAKFISESLGTNDRKAAEAVGWTTLKLMIVGTAALGVTMTLANVIPLTVALMGGLSTGFFLVSLIAAVGNFGGLFSAFLLGLALYDRVAWVTLSNLIVGRAAGIVLAFTGGAAEWVVLGWLGGALFSLVLGSFWTRRRLRLKKSGYPAKKILKFSLPIFSYSLMGLLQSWLDVVLLLWLTRSFRLTGIYYLIVSGSSVLSIIWGAVGTALFPALSAKFGTNDRDSVTRSLCVSARILNITVIPVGLLLSAASRTAILIAVGPQYLEGVAALSLLAGTSIVQAYIFLYWTTIQAKGQTTPMIWIGLAALAADALTLVLLSSTLGILAAALSRLALSIVTLALMHKLVANYADLSSVFREARFSRSLGLALLLATPIAILEWIAPISMALIIRATFYVTIVALLGLAGLRLLRPLDKNDVTLIQDAVGRRFQSGIRILQSFSR